MRSRFGFALTFTFALAGLLTLGACTKSEAGAPDAPAAPAAPSAGDNVLTSMAASATADATCGEAVAATCGDSAPEEKAACCGGGAAKVASAEANEPSCGAHGDHGAKKDGVQVAFEQTPAHGDKALCLVMNREFVVDDRTSTSIYEGKTYAFCCDGCKQVFDANPAKYVHADVDVNVKDTKPSKT